VLAVVNNVVPLKYELFENDALIFKSLQSRYLTILKNQTPLLRVHYQDFHIWEFGRKLMHHFFVLNLGLDIRILLRVPEILWRKKASIIDPEQTFEAKFSIEISNPINKKQNNVVHKLHPFQIWKPNDCI
jgi:hypothetical protein